MPMKTLGKLQTGQSQSFEFAAYNFSGGLNVKSVPQQVGDNDLTIACNGYLTADGGFQLRNGMTAYGNPLPGNGPVYLARYFAGVRNGASLPSENTALLAQRSGQIYSVTPTANTLLGVVGGNLAQQMVARRFQNPNDPNFTKGITDCIVICTGYGGPYVWDGVHFYTPAGWQAATSAQWVEIVNGILWFGGIPDYPNQIFGSGDGITASMETLPGYRNFVFSSPVQGMVSSGTGATAALVVGLQNGLAVLSGTGPSNFYVQEVPFQDAVTAGRTMISSNGVIYFLGHNGVYRFDMQAEPQEISQKVEPWILNSPFLPAPPAAFPMAFNRELSWAAVYNNRLHVGYCSQSALPDTILCYDLIIGGWTVLAPTPGLSSMILLDAPGDPNPYVAMVGASSGGQVYTWDTISTTATQAALDGTTPVLATVQTKYFKLGVPGTVKALERFYPEFFITGPFAANVTASADYGTTLVNTLVDQDTPPQGALVWDQGEWNVNTWQQQSFIPFVAPATRIDYPSFQGESFAFGVSMTQALSPWIFAGGTGVASQQGRV